MENELKEKFLFSEQSPSLGSSTSSCSPFLHNCNLAKLSQGSEYDSSEIGKISDFKSTFHFGNISKTKDSDKNNSDILTESETKLEIPVKFNNEDSSVRVGSSSIKGRIPSFRVEKATPGMINILIDTP